MVRLRVLLNEVPRRSAALLCLGAAAAAAVTAVGVPAAGLAAQDDGDAKADAPADADPSAGDQSFGDDWAGGDGFGDEPAFNARPFAAPATDAPADVSVPGAASVEPVLRAVYRPHPTRVEAVYEFLKANVAAGMDISLRPSTAEDAKPDARELIVVAPEPAQRALGAFLQACVSSEAPESAPVRHLRPAGDAFGPPRGYQDPEPGDFNTSRVVPAATLDSFGDDGFGAAPDAFDGNTFGDPVVADDFGGDGFEDDDFGDEPEFGDEPDPSRTTRKRTFRPSKDGYGDGAWGDVEVGDEF